MKVVRSSAFTTARGWATIVFSFVCEGMPMIYNGQ